MSDPVSDDPARRRRVLVFGSDTGAFLATVRSLGRAGLEVHAAGCEPGCAAGRSRYIAAHHALPPFEGDGSAWRDAVRALVDTHGIGMLFPTSDSSTAQIDGARDAFFDCLLALPSTASLAVLSDKHETRALAARVGVPVAPGCIVNGGTDGDGDAEALVAALGLPLIVKAPKSYAPGNRRQKAAVSLVHAAGDLADRLNRHGPFLVERFVPGFCRGVSVLAIDGEVRQAVQHVRLRQEHETGPSCWRRSERLDPALLAATERMVAATRLTGIAMFEYRVADDESVDTPWVLLEVNARPWGSMPLAMAAGADFPAEFYRWLTAGVAPPPRRDFAAGVERRNAAGELQRLALQWESGTARTAAAGDLVRFCAALTRGKSFDSYAPDDPAPMAAMRQTVAARLTGKLRSAGRSPAPVPDAPQGARPRSTGDVYRGAALAVALTWSLRAIGLVSVFILARILTPADFGVIGLAMTAVAMVELFSYLGLWHAILRLPDPDRSHLDTAWTLQLVMFVFLAAVLAALSWPAAAFYGDPRVAPVIAALSLRFVLLGLANIGTIEWERDFDFGRDLKMRAGARLVSFALTVGLALALHSYWALVAGTLAQALFQTLASYAMHPFRPRLSLARRAELLGVSAWIFVGVSAQIVQGQVERVVVGRTASTAMVGAFAVSKDLASILTQEIATALNRVTYVQTSRSGEFAAQGDRVATMIGAYAVIASAMGFGLAAVAPQFIGVFLGSQWGAAAALVPPIAVASALMAIYKLIASSLSAGKHERASAALSSLGALLVGAAAVAVGLAGGPPLAVAYAGLGGTALLLGIALVTLARLTRHSVRRYAAAVARPLLAGGVMLAALVALPQAAAIGPAALAWRVAAGAVIFATTLALLWRVSGRPASAEAEIARLLTRRRTAAQRASQSM